MWRPGRSELRRSVEAHAFTTFPSNVQANEAPGSESKTNVAVSARVATAGPLVIVVSGRRLSIRIACGAVVRELPVVSTERARIVRTPSG